MAPVWILFLIFVVLVLWVSQGLSALYRVLVTAGMVAAALWIYLTYGNPDLKDYPVARLRGAEDAHKRLHQEQARLRQHLQRHPQDREAWRLLSGTYQAQGQTEIAQHLEAYRQLLEKRGRNPNL